MEFFTSDNPHVDHIYQTLTNFIKNETNLIKSEDEKNNLYVLAIEEFKEILNNYENILQQQ